MKRRALLQAAPVLALAPWTAARAEAFPAKPIRYIVPVAAGGGSDLVGRTVADVERSGRPRNSLTLTTPIGGVIKTLSVRSGMTVSPGQTLAEINGVSRVWLNAAAPEDQASQIRVGQTATATLAVPRAGATAVALPNDQVLILGGRQQHGEPIDTIELFTPDAP